MRAPRLLGLGAWALVLAACGGPSVVTADLLDTPKPAGLVALHPGEPGAARPVTARPTRVFGAPMPVDVDALPVLDPGGRGSIVTASEDEVDMLTWTPRSVDVVRRVTLLTAETHTVLTHAVRVKAIALYPSVLYAFRVHDEGGGADEIGVVGPSARWFLSGDRASPEGSDARAYTIGALAMTEGGSGAVELIVDRDAIEPASSPVDPVIGALPLAGASAVVLNLDLVWPLHGEPALTLRVGTWSGEPAR